MSHDPNMDLTNPRSSDPHYKVEPDVDGFYHCPWRQKLICKHMPTKIKASYDKYLDSHLKPFRCPKGECLGLRFSSAACLLRHEREAHRPVPWQDSNRCPYAECDRSRPGLGFPRQYNLHDHLRRVHGQESD